MPFFRLNTQIVYFAHVPKCGGTTVEVGLREAGLDLCFVSGGWRHIGDEAWVKSPPQHITVDHLNRLFRGEFFDYSFSMVRHPVTRFISAANHNRQNGNLPWYLSLEKIIARVERSPNYLLHQCDNHFIPAIDMVPEGARFFRLEDGLEAVSHGLAEDLDITPINFSFHNRKIYNEVRSPMVVKKLIKKHLQPTIPKIEALPKGLADRIERLYERDFEAFGYQKGHPA